MLMRKPRSYAEVYNDLDEEVVNVFRIMRDAVLAERLMEAVSLTPYSRSDFARSYEFTDDPLERARRTIVKAFMGFGSAAIHDQSPRGMRTRASTWHQPTGFRSNSYRSGSTPATDWARYPSHIPLFVERLRGVVIENRPALDVILQHDTPETLHYIDPPYLHSTRTGRRSGVWAHGYTHEMVEEDHRELSEVLHRVTGMVVVSGYPSSLYDDELYAGWERLERGHFADGARARTEVLWISPRASLPKLQLDAIEAGR